MTQLNYWARNLLLSCWIFHGHTRRDPALPTCPFREFRFDSQSNADVNRWNDICSWALFTFGVNLFTSKLDALFALTLISFHVFVPTTSKVYSNVIGVNLCDQGQAKPTHLVEYIEHIDIRSQLISLSPQPNWPTPPNRHFTLNLNCSPKSSLYKELPVQCTRLLELWAVS